MFSFNSTMVRLVDDFIEKQTNILFLFQFHYGTIGRNGFLFFFSGSIWFQFHYGTIGSYFDKWADRYIYVSIPLWYDW